VDSVPLCEIFYVLDAGCGVAANSAVRQEGNGIKSLVIELREITRMKKMIHTELKEETNFSNILCGA